MKYPTLIVNPPAAFATDDYLEAHLGPRDVVLVLCGKQKIHKRHAANREHDAFMSCLGPSYRNTTDIDVKEAIVAGIHDWYCFVTFSERLQRYVKLNDLDPNPNNPHCTRRSKQKVQGTLRRKAAYPGVQLLPNFQQVNRLFHVEVADDGSNTAA